MDEVRFVLKCFAFAAVLLVISQLKTKSGTIESDIQAVLVNSKTSEFVNMAAQGGHKALKQLATYIQDIFHNQTKNLAELTETKEAVAEKAKSVSSEIDTKAAQDMAKTILNNSEELLNDVEAQFMDKKKKAAVVTEPLIEEIE